MEPRSSTPGVDRYMRPVIFFFFRKFNFVQLLFDAFFDIIGIFAVCNPKGNFPIPVLYNISKMAKFGGPLAPLPDVDKDMFSMSNPNK